MIRNVHSREYEAPPEAAEALLSTLGGEEDRLWPAFRWPAMRFKGPREPGQAGGHGPIRYTIEAWEPRFARFRFTAPKGFHGHHQFRIEALPGGRIRLSHEVEMEAQGRAYLTWALGIRWLHDALLEDALDRASGILGHALPPRPLGLWVRFLRRALQGRRL